MQGKEVKEAKSSHQKKILAVLIDSVLLFLLPFLSVIIEHVEVQSSLNWMLLGKWLVFWTFGFRLFASGIKQASDPSVTVKKSNNEMFTIARELGIANICLGVGGILSLINETWRQIIAILGCLFFGLDTIRCLTNELSSASHKMILLFNLVIFAAFFLYIIFSLKYL